MSSPSIRSYNVVLEPSPEGGYVAVVPALPGCYSQGDTVDEALAGAREAIELTIEDMEARGEPIPDAAGEVIAKVAVGHTEQSAADAFAAVGPWEGETPDELPKRLSRARPVAPVSEGCEDPLAWEGDGWDDVGARRKS
jgi:antitoxin HicB